MGAVFSELNSSVPISNADFEAAFKSFDRDGSGGITKEEMADFIAQAAGLNSGSNKGPHKGQDSNSLRISSDFKMSLMGGFNQTGLQAKRLSDAIIQKAAEAIDNEVTCKKHRDQPLVAFDEASEYFGCHQCIYDGDYEDPQFITLKARDIHDRLKANYLEFKEVQGLLNEVQPQVVTQNIRLQVS